MDPGLRPISNHRQYSPYIQQKSLASLKWVAPLCIVFAIINIIIGFMWYSFNGLTEYLLTGLNNIAILFICVFSLYWSFTYIIVSDVVNQQEAFPTSPIPYLHALFTQLSCAIQSGIVFSLIEYDSYNQFILVLPCSVVQIFFLLYIANVSRQFNVREYGVQRLIVYGASAVNLIFLGFAAYNLKQVIQQINLQLITISSNNQEIQIIKIILLVLFITTIILSLFNLRRIKIYFVLLSFIVIGVCIITSCANGLLIRKVQQLEMNLSTNNGCRYVMQSISETSLKKDLSCSQKYFDQDLSPYLPCDQTEQTYNWEQNSNKLGCINTSCCDTVKKFVFNPINNLTIWINLIIMVGLVQAFNAAMLSEGSYKRFRMHIVGDGAMFIILLLLCILVVIVYNFTPDLGVQVQHTLVKEQSVLNQVSILPTPVYSNFDKQKRLVGFYNLQSCEPLQVLMLQKINFKSEDNKKGIAIAIQGTNGEFTILNNYNNQDLKIVQSITDKLFIKPQVPYDEIIIKGSVTEAENLIKNFLYFCTENPLSSDFTILTEFYDLSRLLQATKESQNQMNQALKFYEVKVNIEDASNLQPIQNADIQLYEGRFIAQSCQIITQLENEMYTLQTDENGQVTFNNLSQGNTFTIFIYKPGFKKTCSVIDLSRRNPKTTHIFRLIKDISKHSMRVLLEWTSNTLDLDLYGIFKVNEHQCITGSLSKSCGGMEYTSLSKGDQHIEILNLNELEPQVYTVFVKRYLSRIQVLDVISKTGVNQDWIDSDPRITVYLSEISYPLIEFRLPQITNSISETVDLTWMVFQIDGVQSDAPISLQKLQSEIKNDEIRTNTASNKPFWPNI